MPVSTESALYLNPVEKGHTCLVLKCMQVFSDRYNVGLQVHRSLEQNQVFFTESVSNPSWSSKDEDAFAIATAQAYTA